jgi:hypothetical protein
MEWPIEPKEEQSGASGAHVLFNTFESTNAGFSSFPVSNSSSPTAFSHVDSTEK